MFTKKHVKNVKRFWLTFALLAILSVWVSRTWANAQQEGYALAKLIEAKQRGYGDIRFTAEMILRDPMGGVAQRKLRMKLKEVPGIPEGGDRALLVFDAPKDIRGTALLIWTLKGDTEEDQWLYLPANKRVKRIMAGHRTGSFMASEFLYEDLGSQTLEKFTYRRLKDAKINGLDCYGIERVPVNGNSAYSKQVAYFDKNELRLQLVNFYDKNRALLKVLTATGYQQQGRFWRASKLEMVNKQTGYVTTLLITDMRYNTGLKDSDFDQDALKSAN